MDIITYYCTNCGSKDRPYMDFWTELCSECGAEGPEVIKESTVEVQNYNR
jgi:NADH pyrophosphatase NudC (nudix superfamily)